MRGTALVEGSYSIDCALPEMAERSRRENVERAPSALVQLEERDDVEHFGCFFTLRQKDLPIGPKPEPLIGSHKIGLSPNVDRRAQSASDGNADRMI